MAVFRPTPITVSVRQLVRKVLPSFVAAVDLVTQCGATDTITAATTVQHAVVKIGLVCGCLQTSPCSWCDCGLEAEVEPHSVRGRASTRWKR